MVTSMSEDVCPLTWPAWRAHSSERPVRLSCGPVISQMSADAIDELALEENTDAELTADLPDATCHLCQELATEVILAVVECRRQSHAEATSQPARRRPQSIRHRIGPSLGHGRSYSPPALRTTPLLPQQRLAPTNETSSWSLPGPDGICNHRDQAET
jgi:hypothetical protein